MQNFEKKSLSTLLLSFKVQTLFNISEKRILLYFESFDVYTKYKNRSFNIKKEFICFVNLVDKFSSY